MLSEYWLISAPGDKTCQQTWETMNNLTSKQHKLSINYKFAIPDLKVGTLDQLVGLSDDLGKLDTFVESVTRKIAHYLGEVLEDQRDKLQENLLANNGPGPPNSALVHHSLENNTHKNITNSMSNSSSSKSLNKIFKNRVDTQLSTSLSTQSTLINSTNTPTNIITSSATKLSKSTTNLFCKESLTKNDSIESERDVYLNDNSASTNIISDNNNSCNCCDNNNSENDEDDNSSDTFEWWFQRHKRGSNKSRSRSSSQIHSGFSSTHRTSPVSSCCGSSQGRSSPDCDLNGGGLGEPPSFPLSPADLPSYLTHFQWDMAKYPIKQSLRNIADIISKQIGQIDGDLKTKSTAYNNLKGSLQNLEKKQTGSLLTRNLAELVKKDHFIQDSEYLTTVLVIVPRSSVADWYAHYEKITDMIVPRSSTLITQDNEYALFNVHLFKKVVEEFKLHAREKKFIVRDFAFNEEELSAGKNEMSRVITEKKKQFGPLVRWLKVNFSESFCAWIHVKALRVFVESVLRYGLPVNFQAMLIQPHKKNIKRLRDILQQLYSHLDGSTASGAAGGADVDLSGLGFGQSEYYPYVYYKIVIDMIEAKA